MLTGGWVAAMAAGHSGGCWDDYSASNTIYIIVVPMTLTLSVTVTNTSSRELSHSNEPLRTFELSEHTDK